VSAAGSPTGIAAICLGAGLVVLASAWVFVAWRRVVRRRAKKALAGARRPAAPDEPREGAEPTTWLNPLRREEPERERERERKPAKKAALPHHHRARPHAHAPDRDPTAIPIDDADASAAQPAAQPAFAIARPSLAVRAASWKPKPLDRPVAEPEPEPASARRLAPRPTVVSLRHWAEHGELSSARDVRPTLSSNPLQAAAPPAASPLATALSPAASYAVASPVVVSPPATARPLDAPSAALSPRTWAAADEGAHEPARFEASASPVRRFAIPVRALQTRRD